MSNFKEILDIIKEKKLERSEAKIACGKHSPEVKKLNEELDELYDMLELAKLQGLYGDK